MKTKYYTVEELKLIGMSTDDSQKCMEGQLTIFRPCLITGEGQLTIESLLPNKQRKRSHRALTYSYNAKKRKR